MVEQGGPSRGDRAGGSEVGTEKGEGCTGAGEGQSRGKARDGWSSASYIVG